MIIEFLFMNAIELSMRHFGFIMVFFFAYLVENIVLVCNSGKDVYQGLSWTNGMSYLILFCVLLSDLVVYAILVWISKKKTKFLMK